MPGVVKRLLVPDRRRCLPPGGFSWIDRRIVQDHFLGGLSGPESLLYFFLVTVADRDGLSFHGDRKTAALLKLPLPTLEQARRGLERKDLICYRAPLYQVLSLPDAPAGHSLEDYVVDRGEPAPPQPSTPSGQPRAIGAFLRTLTRKPD